MHLLSLTKITVFIFLIIVYSCRTRVDYKVSGEFRYHNRLPYTAHVSIKHGMNKIQDSFDISPGSIYVITTGDIGPRVMKPEDYTPGISADTLTLRFNDSLCYTEYNKQGPLLNNMNKYTKRGDADYIFNFNIDSVLLNQAQKCP